MKNNNNELIDYMINDFKSGIKHGVLVANLTYELAQMCGLSKDEAYELKIAAMVHDVGKLNYQNTYMAEILANYQSKR